MRKDRDGGKKRGGKQRGKKERKKKKENTDEDSGHYVIASSRPPNRRPLERRTLAPKISAGVFAIPPRINRVRKQKVSPIFIGAYTKGFVLSVIAFLVCENISSVFLEILLFI